MSAPGLAAAPKPKPMPILPEGQMIEEIYNHLVSIDGFGNLSLEDIHIEPLQTLAHSEVYRIRLNSLSTSLILKKSGAADVAGLANRERQFYRHVAPLLPSWLVPQCLLIIDGDQTGRLFIEDLSASHRSACSPAPTRMECRCFVEALATLHGLTGRGSTIQGKWTKVAADLPAGTIQQRLSFFQLVLGPFISAIHGSVDRAVESFLTGLNDLEHRIKRAGDQADVIVHGDAHFANALFSPEPCACLIDWGMPMVGFGEIDLAHALALNLPPNLRREWEQEMMDVYLSRMAACGSPLDGAAFLDRYRLGVLYSFISPVVWWCSGVPEPQWRSALMNSLDAARELGLIE